MQKLTTPLEDGSNLIFTVKYLKEDSLPVILNIYNAGSISMVLKDDGVYPDEIANDGIYATYKTEDIPQMITDITTRENQIQHDGGVMHFTGHDGAFIKSSDIPIFNQQVFNNGGQVEIPTFILDATLCGTSIKKQNSLFITDLKVVEDPARTYNVFNNTGTPTGALTFGTLIRNIVNNSTTPNATRDFLKSWVNNYLINQSVSYNATIAIGYTDILARSKVIRHLIAPWITKAYTGSTNLVSINSIGG